MHIPAGAMRILNSGSCGLCRFRGGDAVESFHASAADFADFMGARCGSLGCGLCKILRGLCNLPGADHPGGHAELQQPMPTTDANRSIQHSRLRHAGMPPVRRHVIWRHMSSWTVLQSVSPVGRL